jgi:threonine dehydratase
VITASAGNHAQGVALSGAKLGIPAIIVMPQTTPDIKVQAVKRLGGQVVLHGDAFDAANKYAQQRAQEEGLTFIPPYDDEMVIAGQGTLPTKFTVNGAKLIIFLLLLVVVASFQVLRLTLVKLHRMSKL